jgi:hypothetical protein
MIVPFVQFTGHVQATTLFEDGFESGDLSAWTGSSGSVSASSTVVNEGTYSARSNSDSGVLSKTLTPATTVFSRNYFYFSAIPSHQILTESTLSTSKTAQTT